MAIVPLVKVTLYGPARDREAVLDGLQGLGCLHLVSLGADAVKRPEASPVATEAREALAYLEACPLHRRPVTDPARFDLAAVQAKALEVRDRERELRDEQDGLRNAVTALEPWGDFGLPAEGAVGGQRFWFYVVPHHRVGALDGTGLTWQVASRDNRSAYVVVLSAAEPSGVPGTRACLDGRPLSELRRRLEGVAGQLEDLHWRRVDLTRWRSLLRLTLDEADDRAAREHAARQAVDAGRVFVVGGWIPREALPRVEAFAARGGLALTAEEPGPDDSPPTLLRNPKRLAGGEDVVTFYMTPGYRTWDPSLVVFASFAVFFAMILADAGYGLVLSLLLLLLWHRLGRSEGGRRFRNLAVVLVVASVAYGVLAGSYFGLAPPQGSALSALHLLDTTNQGLMMRLSIGVGVLHLVLAQLVTAWRESPSPRALAPLGWAAVFVGGYGLGLGATGTAPDNSLVRAGTPLLAGGALAVLLFSSRRPLTLRGRDLGGRLFDGARALAGISQAFGDVLSYLRLFALGLAGAQLARTFNDLVYQASCCIGVGSLLALLVVVLGHGLNLALGVMSGVVHGLRLNCIEFFNWGLPEEGYPFQPFFKKAGL